MRLGSLLGAPLGLALARARRRPGRWLLTVLGIGLATAFTGAVAVESTVASDQSARSQLSSLPADARAVRVTWQGIVTPSVQARARGMLRGLGLGAQTEVVLMNPVRLSGEVVRPAAIDPLGRWGARTSPGPCLPTRCPMLLAGGTVSAKTLSTFGATITVAGAVKLSSDVPLGYLPGTSGGQAPTLVTGDPNGLEALAGLSGVYRTHSWLAVESTSALHEWDLARVEERLASAQAALQASDSEFSLSAPFTALDAARAQASAAPRRLLLAGGGALAALALFVVLAAGGLRRDQSRELARLRSAGARTGQCVAFVVAEATLISGVGIVLGALVGLGVGAELASASGLPVGPVLDHSLLTPLAGVAVIAGWICATALITTLQLARDLRIVDGLAVAAVAALVLGLARSPGGNDPLPVLLAPLCCLAAGVIVFRLASGLLRAVERAVRGGPVLARVALVGLARSPSAPSLAIAFIAVSTGLGGFALAYRATLVRGARDEAAAQVPLDAIVAPSSDFTRPLQLAPLSRWRSLAHGPVLPVRRTDATFPSGAATATVPALGVPASALTQLRGWRAGDSSAPLRTLARRLVPPGPARRPGPELPPGSAELRLTTLSPHLSLDVSADLRDRDGNVRQLILGVAGGPRPKALSARLPPGHWELDGFTLSELSGLEITSGHQNGENPAAATQFGVNLSLGPARVLGAAGEPLGALPLSGWVAVGGAGAARSQTGRLELRFGSGGETGVVRPPQPSDSRLLPVLTDPGTAHSAAPGGRLPLTVDGETVDARVVGTLARFPTLENTGSGFVVADEATLASALDAQLPGQGRADELWVATPDLASFRAAVSRGGLAQLAISYRADIQHRLRVAPIARGVLGTLIAAAALAVALAVLGLLVSLLGQDRDERFEQDLIAQGVGPRGLRRELRLRMLLAATIGVAVGVAVAALLTRLAVATVRAAGLVADPHPPLVTVAPWAQLVLWALAALAILALASWMATRVVLASRQAA